MEGKGNIGSWARANLWASNGGGGFLVWGLSDEGRRVKGARSARGNPQSMKISHLWANISLFEQWVKNISLHNFKLEEENYGEGGDPSLAPTKQIIYLLDGKETSYKQMIYLLDGKKYIIFPSKMQPPNIP